MTTTPLRQLRDPERSSYVWFVLHERLGHHNVKNYDGSLTEHGSPVGAPIELGN